MYFASLALLPESLNFSLLHLYYSMNFDDGDANGRVYIFFQVVDYLLGNFCSSDSDDGDSDSDDQSVSRLWAYPKATLS